jgi:hypothetical protein
MELPPDRTPAVVISDSFGRPWRWGIVDIALGVAGFGPLDDQRGRPDTAGRVMRSTIVAVADEIASAAELASGKTSGRPVILVRGAALPPGGGSIRDDVVMPPRTTSSPRETPTAGPTSARGCYRPPAGGPGGERDKARPSRAVRPRHLRRPHGTLGGDQPPIYPRACPERAR